MKEGLKKKILEGAAAAAAAGSETETVNIDGHLLDLKVRLDDDSRKSKEKFIHTLWHQHMDEIRKKGITLHILERGTLNGHLKDLAFVEPMPTGEDHLFPIGINIYDKINVTLTDEDCTQTQDNRREQLRSK